MNSTTIRTGSYPFFHMYDDYKYYTHDEDYIVLVNNLNKAGNTWYVNNHCDYFLYPFVNDKKKFLQWIFEKCERVPIAICSVLNISVARIVGFDISEIKCFHVFVEKLDKKHQYLGFIFECFVKNNDFVLTDEQRDEAYETYKSSRTKKEKV